MTTALGGRAQTGRIPLTLDAFQDWRRDRLIEGHGYQVPLDESILGRQGLGLPEEHPRRSWLAVHVG